MQKLIIYCIFLLVAFSSCEDIYTPDVEDREGVIVANARIIVGNDNNYIELYKSIGFNEISNVYPAVSNAMVYIIDSNGDDVQIHETEDGIYPVYLKLNSELEYKLKIEYDSNIYESTFEPVPNVPEIDTFYGIEELKLLIEEGENSVDDYKSTIGLQTYCDINKLIEPPYYRFSARKVMQYYYIEFPNTEFSITHYMWNSYFPSETFNIASPPEYTTGENIEKHPLFFVPKRVFLGEDNYFHGWILIIHQFALSKSSYNFYKDLNSQLNSDGKLFDPLYVQARNNLKCTNNPEQLILGNFEISTPKEYRFFVKFISDDLGYKVEPIYDFYDIPFSGDSPIVYPDFWQH
ncbi:MAG: DUF4249 family protein [Draconibacterium sp.]|nr:DUF4249 family protein [Draconibacterium sp.]